MLTLRVRPTHRLSLPLRRAYSHPLSPVGSASLPTPSRTHSVPGEAVTRLLAHPGAVSRLGVLQILVLHLPDLVVTVSSRPDLVLGFQQHFPCPWNQHPRSRHPHLPPSLPSYLLLLSRP